MRVLRFVLALALLTPMVTAQLWTPTISAAGMTVNIDASAGVHSISPYIYGIANSAGATSWQKQMGVSLVRWGGNARSRHNWEINASNAGSDWGPYLNVDQLSGNRTAGKASVDFVNANKAVGADSLITIPTLGWVAKDTSSESTSVPSQGGAAISPGSGAIAGYDPSSNRSRTSVPSYPKKPTPFSYPPSTSDGAVYQDEWVNYLKSTFGSASSGGVRFYAMDNEPDLWADSTHADVHPVRAGYEETLKRFKDYATAVKAVDPSSQILGPVGWGWLSLWFSGLDIGSDNYSSAPDRAAHGNVPFYAWFLQQMKAYDQSLGQRTLDVLDVHYYPQGGVFSSSVDSATQAKRLRSTRSLWDPSYADESWQASTEGGPYLMLIPRLKELVSQYYPGTKVGISEWNWGADSNINGALAIADVLGIFGREDLYLANYWTSPEQNSPGYFAFRMFRNYDGSYSSFGDTSLKASVGAADVDKISAYASRDSKSGELKLILINKMPGTRADVNLNISNFSPGSSAKVYQYASSDASRIKRLPDLTGVTRNLGYSLPPYSITMLVFGKSTAPAVSNVYVNSLVNWRDESSGARVSYKATSPVFSPPYSISFANTKGGGALALAPSAGSFDTTPFTHLRFQANGGAIGRQRLGIKLYRNGAWGPLVNVSKYMGVGGIAAARWKLVDIPLADLGAKNARISHFAIQDLTGGPQPTTYFDNIKFIHK